MLSRTCINKLANDQFILPFEDFQLYAELQKKYGGDEKQATEQWHTQQYVIFT